MLGIVFFRFDNRVNLKADKFSNDSLLEIFLNIAPAVILLFISLPYFALLYSLDELTSLFLRLIATSSQDCRTTPSTNLGPFQDSLLMLSIFIQKS